LGLKRNNYENMSSEKMIKYLGHIRNLKGVEMNQEQIVEVILKEAKGLQKVLNENFMVEFCKLHNVKPEYNLLSLKQELVAKRGYLLKKKKYALWIVNMEGVPVEEYDIKGLVTRRSDYSEATKENIKKLLDLLLKEEVISFANIKKFVDETRNTILKQISAGDKKIARPVSFTKKLTEYKKVPSHVEGMLLWNTLMYEYFLPGTRGYQFKISGIDPLLSTKRVKKNMSYFDPMKHNNIVLPYEEEKLPEFFVIDKESSLKFTWDDRVSEILEPIIDKVNSLGKRERKIVTF